MWPNSQDPVFTLRLFRAWNKDWDEKDRIPAWKQLIQFAIGNGAKILLGTQITCNPEDDEQDWQWVKEFATEVGPNNIMGLAVGNELDLLYTKQKEDASVSDACIRQTWSGGEFWRTFVNRVKEFDKLGAGFKKVPVTNVFSAAALGGNPFQEEPKKALVTSFLRNATETYKIRYAFTFNHYSYFDPNIELDPGTTNECQNALNVAACWYNGCMIPGSMSSARRKMTQLTGRTDDLYWVGETGWSSPQSHTLGTHMSSCKDWSSSESFERFYKGFLSWDFKVPDLAPPDHVFYFSVHASLNFGILEHFGLIDACHDLECKLRTANYTAPPEEAGADMGWRKHGFIAMGCLVVAALAGVLCWVTVPEDWRKRCDYGVEESSSSSDESE